MDERTDRSRADSAEAAPTDRQTLVIVGNGMMSWKLCQKLVECGAHQVLDIVVFGEEPHPAYDRVHLTDLLSSRTMESLILAPESWYEDHNIKLYVDEPVREIDREDCVVRSDHREVPYDRLVFATGSHPFVPPINGATPRDGVFVYRTIENVADIMEYGDRLAEAADAADEVACAAVLGGGLLGLEAAKAVHDLGLEVHVVEFAPGLMSRQLDARAQALLKEKIEQLGVRVHVGKQTTLIEDVPRDAQMGTYRGGDATVRRLGEQIPDVPIRVLHFADGKSLEVDMVIISAGIRPRGDLAAAAGLEMAKNGGIVVDDHLATSDPRIFAVGECAVHRGTTYGLALPGYKMVEILVDNLVGGIATFESADMSAKLKLMGVTVASLGDFNEKDSLVYDANGTYRKLTMRDGKIVGCIAIGEWDNLDQVRDAIDQPRLVSIWDTRRFKSTGSLWKKSESLPIAEWAPETLVCGCLRVNRGTLSMAQLDGCLSVEELCARTGAGTMCGSCKPLLAELLGGSRDSVPPSSRLSVPPVSVRGAPISRRGGLIARSGAGAPLSARSGAGAPLSARSGTGAPLSARDGASTSKRRSITPPPYEPFGVARLTPTPAVPVLASSPPATAAATAAAADAAAEAPMEDGPLSRRGSMLPQVPGRRSSLRAPPSVRVEVASPLGRELETVEGAGVSISFTQTGPDEGEEPAPISVRVPGSVSPRPPSTHPRGPSTSKRLSLGKLQVRARDDASTVLHDSILPPAPEIPADLSPPDSAPPPSLRDFLPPAVRNEASHSHSLREVAAKLSREASHDADGDAKVSSRDLSRSRDALRAPGALRTRDPALAAPRVPDLRGDAEPNSSSNPPGHRDSAPPPSRRRDSMPPLRPISVPPVKGSVAPGRVSIPPGRLSVPPRSGIPEERGVRLLLSASIGAFIAAAVVATMGPIPPAGTAYGTHLDALWTSSSGKQLTGYAVVVLGLLSLLLSLRKRWKRFTYSDMPAFRIFHATLGALTLVMLVFHTGLHLGRNMNRVLMIDFLALGLLGSIAGGVTALSHWFRPADAMNQRVVWTRAHLILFWPLPVLLALHILGAYYF